VPESFQKRFKTCRHEQPTRHITLHASPKLIVQHPTTVCCAAISSGV
jgi:hypothetical protein